ncbi:MAG: hypothetical protein AB1442_11145 [Nitrospirota bacterium]
MEVKRYRIIDLGQGRYSLHHGTLHLGSFSRDNLRESLEEIADEFDFSSNWIGAILRIFNKMYPFPHAQKRRTALDRLLFLLGGDDGAADYLRSIGCRVVKRLPSGVSKMDIVRHLEGNGWEIAGLIDGCYHETSLVETE